jgi:hypothetical protein
MRGARKSYALCAPGLAGRVLSPAIASQTFQRPRCPEPRP